MMQIKDRKFLVVGLGKSGVAATRFLLSKGAHVTAADIKNFDDLSGDAKSLVDLDVAILSGPHNPSIVSDFEAVVVSPGVPPGNPLLEAARAKGIEIVGEMELSVREIKKPIIAVTGTNGKTTTTALIGHLLRSSGFDVCVAGNIGTPLLSVIESAHNADFVVVEVSSFQIETTKSLKPFIAIVLNITPDHLDWHASYEEYVECKARLVTQGENFGVYNAADSDVSGLVMSSHATLIPFDATGRVLNGRGGKKSAWFEGGDLCVRVARERASRYPLADVRLEGIHNRENMLAALAACELAGAEPHLLSEGLKSFKGLPHRLELVGEFRGVRYYDDSKGTNVGATARAIENFAEPIVLIAGGLAKGVDFADLALKMRGRVKEAVLIGEAKEAIESAIKGEIKTTRASDMADAVRKAASLALPGEVVLLSPACASFDMFRDYAHRGEEFVRAVTTLMRE